MSKGIDLLTAARWYVSKGLSVLPVKGDKSPVFSWELYQNRLHTPQELSVEFSDQRGVGIGVVCGAVSGGLEVIDVDTKYDLTGTLLDEIQERVRIELPDVFEKLYLVRTVSGGAHLYYKCEVVDGNAKLARRHTTEEERSRNQHEKVKVLIETRGNGGFVVAPPTPGYQRVNDFNIPLLTIDQRETLLNVMRSFDQLKRVSRPKAIRKFDSTGLTPWDDYSIRADHAKLLQKHGWTYRCTVGLNEHWTRPGKQYGTSATFHLEKRIFYVFSSSTPFDSPKGYALAAVYAILEHDGDYSIAAKNLFNRGYGRND